MTQSTKTAKVKHASSAGQHHMRIDLDDGSAVHVGKVFEAPPVGTELTILLDAYRLPPEVDPHQDERFRVVRISWTGPIEIHAAEFDELMAEHEVLRANLAHARKQLGQAQQGLRVGGQAPQNPFAGLGQRLSAALRAFTDPEAPPPAAPPPQDAPFPTAPSAPPGAPVSGGSPWTHLTGKPD